MTEIADRFLPIHLLSLARSMMRVPRADLIGTWPRASAILGRQALEITLDQLWTQAAPGAENAPARAQLTCLPEYIDTELASRIRYSWHALSAACHYHAYELPSTAAELNGWFDDVEALIDEVRTRDHALLPNSPFD